jgi:hypothetical protein
MEKIRTARANLMHLFMDKMLSKNIKEGLANLNRNLEKSNSAVTAAH